MIEFKNISKELPYVAFKAKYNEAIKAGQKNIEAIAISSYNTKNNQVDSRFVNLKFIDFKQFIFFSNYNSPKSIAFDSHKQISALIYWPSINTQIRMKAKINRTSREYNVRYFKQRSFKKNALAISSNQSKPIKSFDHVVRKYENSIKKYTLSECPDYWGGFSFVPYEFEIWEGSSLRLNKRNFYKKNTSVWSHFILEP